MMKKYGKKSLSGERKGGILSTNWLGFLNILALSVDVDRGEINGMTRLSTGTERRRVDLGPDPDSIVLYTCMVIRVSYMHCV